MTVGHTDDMEYRLVRDLMRHYDQRIRPSKNSSEALNVTFGLALAQIIDVVSGAPKRRVYVLVVCMCALLMCSTGKKKQGLEPGEHYGWA